MKITKVDVFQEKAPAEHPGWRPILCRIYTGIYGDGEAALSYGVAAPAAFGMIKDLATLIIGMDPLDNEVIWDKLYKCTFWGQNGGPVVFAGISAIDIALWDIKGKFFNVPIYKLLGGKRRDNLRTYASQLTYGWGPGTNHKCCKPEEYAENCRIAVAQGYDCVKLDFFNYDVDGTVWNGPGNAAKGEPMAGEIQTRLLSPYYVKVVEDRVAACREAVGPNVDIIVENHSWAGRWPSTISSTSRSPTPPPPRPPSSSPTSCPCPSPTASASTPAGSTPPTLRTCPCRSSSPTWATAAASPRARKSATWPMCMT